MVNKLGGLQGWLVGFLAAYFVLLLFCFSVFMFQGGIWLLVGLTSLICCCVAFFGWFIRINYRYHRKCYRVVSLGKEQCIVEAKGKVMNFS